MKEILGWHFLYTDRRLGYGDDRIVKTGKTYSCKFPYECGGNIYTEPMLCHAGMHASEKIIDALTYANDPIVCRVKLHGNIKIGDDKMCAKSRTVLWMVDAERVLHEAACRFAERALSRIKNPAPESIAAIQAKRDWLAGKISDKELMEAAREAAKAAARPAELAAARAAELAAELAAAWAAARAAMAAKWAAELAAEGAAELAAAWAAAWAARAAEWAEREIQNRILTGMIIAEAKKQGVYCK